MKKLLCIMLLTSLGLQAMEESYDPGQKGSIHHGNLDQNQIERQYFFNDIVGMSESKFRKLYNWNNHGLALPETNGRLRNLPFDIRGFEQGNPLPRDIKAWIAEYPRRAAIFEGIFTFQTNTELLSKIKSARKQSILPKKIGKPRFVVRLHNPLNPKPTDIRYLQADRHNKNATSQIASTFFGPVEGGMIIFDNTLGISGKKKGMFAGAAQGEESSVSVGAATIERKYLMPTKRIASGKSFGYHYSLAHLRDKKSNLRFPWKVYGHHADISRKATEHYYPPFIGKDTVAFNNDSMNVGIGIHENVVVTSGYGNFNGKPALTDRQQRLEFLVDLTTGKVVPETAQLINQVFTSAYKLPNTVNLNQKTFARMILQGAYRGTINAAYYLAQKNNNPDNGKLFLTLVGGGAFNNDIAWIQEALEQQGPAIKNFGLDVTLLYRPDVNKKHRTLKGDRSFIQHMITMMDTINGTEWSNNNYLQELINNYLIAAYKTKDKQKQGEYAFQINQLLDDSYAFDPFE